MNILTGSTHYPENVTKAIPFSAVRRDSFSGAGSGAQYYYYYYYFIPFTVFPTSVRRCYFYMSLSDSKSPQVSRTLLCILAYLNNAVVWMVSACLLIFKFSGPFINHLGIIPSTPITTGITVTFMIHNFFSSLARPRYLYLFSSFNLTLWSAGTEKSTLRQFLFLLLIYTTCSYGQI